MRRRLSIAISIVSKPKVVFLDEPSTGLDPETRRQLWNILQDVKKAKDRAMVMTTHSMEEADILCNRIGIVNLGVMQCIGSQNRLKSLYGGGYHLFINCERYHDPAKAGKQKQTVISFIKKTLPKSLLLREFNSQFVYQVPTDGFNAEELFNDIQSKRDSLGIQDWGISQCSLEDVFTRICELN